MYIELSGVRYPCTGTPTLTGDTLRFCLPGSGETLAGVLTGPPEGTVTLCGDDGFVLRELDVSGYLRWGMEGETLVVTNRPVPEPVEPGPPPVPSTEDALVRAVVDLQFEVDRLKLGGTGL